MIGEYSHVLAIVISTGGRQRGKRRTENCRNGRWARLCQMMDTYLIELADMRRQTYRKWNAKKLRRIHLRVEVAAMLIACMECAPFCCRCALVFAPKLFFGSYCAGLVATYSQPVLVLLNFPLFIHISSACSLRAIKIIIRKQQRSLAPHRPSRTKQMPPSPAISFKNEKYIRNWLRCLMPAHATRDASHTHNETK